MKTLTSRLAAVAAIALLALPAWAVEVAFQPVADGVYAYVGDTDGRSIRGATLAHRAGRGVPRGPPWNDRFPDHPLKRYASIRSASAIASARR